jgi:RHS repeat-associated protein
MTEQIMSKTSGESSGMSESSWGYNDKGQLVSQGGLGFSSGGAFSYSSSSGRRLEAHLHPRLAGALEEKYRYYDDGRVKKGGSFTDADDGTYTYNAHGDMKTATLGSSTRNFHYLPKNRLDWTQVVEGEDEGDRTYYDWDANTGQRTGKSVGTLSDGVWSRPTTWKTVYGYDAAGRLISFDDATDAAHKNKATYTYDAEGFRIRTKLTEDYNLTAADRTVTTTDYLYDAGRLLSMTITKTDEQATPVLKGKWQMLYLYDAKGRPYAGVNRNLQTGVTHSFFLVTTDRGDVIQLMDGAHNVFASYRYDVYGRPTDTTTQATNLLSAAWAAQICDQNVLRYASYCYDPHSGFYYLQQRYYDPLTRQFVSQDPLKADGDESPYQYCAGSPILQIDPTGERIAVYANNDQAAGKKIIRPRPAMPTYINGYYYYGGFGGVAAYRPPAPRLVRAAALTKLLTAYQRAAPVSLRGTAVSSPEPEHSHGPSEEQVHNEEVALSREDQPRRQGPGPQHPVPVERRQGVPQMTPWWRSGDQPAFASEGEAMLYYMYQRPSGVPSGGLLIPGGASFRGVPNYSNAPAPSIPAFMRVFLSKPLLSPYAL